MRLLLLALLALTTAPACDATTAPVDAVSPRDAGPPPRYEEDVRPILHGRCVGCHREGQIAPFALDTYEAAAPLASRIAEVTRARTMPPFLANASGTCGTYRDARWLSDTEIDTLDRWAAASAPRGDETIPPPDPPTPAGLIGETTEADLGVDYLPSTERSDDYRCFVTGAPFSTERFVTGFDVAPGNPRLVHHVLVYLPAGDAAAADARALDESDPGPGYACFGGAGIAVRGVLAAWAPGSGAVTFPEGVGIEPGTGPLVIQVHYNTLGSDGRADRTRVRLAHAGDVHTAVRILPLADTTLSLPPRQSLVTTTSEARVADSPLVTRPFRVFGAYPHMHTLGRSLRVEVRHADGSTECLLDVPRWDFDWQLFYLREAPLTIHEDDTLVLHCDYDTTSRDETVRWGEGTDDEMCLVGLLVDL